MGVQTGLMWHKSKAPLNVQGTARQHSAGIRQSTGVSQRSIAAHAKGKACARHSMVHSIVGRRGGTLHAIIRFYL